MTCLFLRPIPNSKHDQPNPHFPFQHPPLLRMPAMLLAVQNKGHQEASDDIPVPAFRHGQGAEDTL